VHEYRQSESCDAVLGKVMKVRKGPILLKSSMPRQKRPNSQNTFPQAEIFENFVCKKPTLEEDVPNCGHIFLASEFFNRIGRS
jgi:hypothetical protein